MSKNHLFVVLTFTILLLSFAVYAERQPVTGQDRNVWGTILNAYLNISFNENGSLKANFNASSYNFNITNQFFFGGQPINTTIAYIIFIKNQSGLYIKQSDFSLAINISNYTSTAFIRDISTYNGTNTTHANDSSYTPCAGVTGASYDVCVGSGSGAVVIFAYPNVTAYLGSGGNTTILRIENQSFFSTFFTFANNLTYNNTLINQYNFTWINSTKVRNATWSDNTSGVACAGITGADYDVCDGDGSGSGAAVLFTYANVSAFLGFGGNASLLRPENQSYFGTFYTRTNFTSDYNNRTDRINFTNWTNFYDLRTDRYSNLNFTVQYNTMSTSAWRMQNYTNVTMSNIPGLSGHNTTIFAKIELDLRLNLTRNSTNLDAEINAGDLAINASFGNIIRNGSINVQLVNLNISGGNNKNATIFQGNATTTSNGSHWCVPRC